MLGNAISSIYFTTIPSFEVLPKPFCYCITFFFLISKNLKHVLKFLKVWRSKLCIQCPCRLYGLGCVSLSFSDAPGKGMTPPPPHQQNRDCKASMAGERCGPCFPLLSDLVSASWELQSPGSAFLKWERMSQEFAIYPPASQARAAVVVRVLMAL